MTTDEYIDKLIGFGNKIVNGFADSLKHYQNFRHNVNDLNYLLGGCIAKVSFYTKKGDQITRNVSSCQPLIVGYQLVNKFKGQLAVTSKKNFLNPNHRILRNFVLTWDLDKNDFCEINTQRDWTVLQCIRYNPENVESINEILKEAVRKQK